MIPPSDRSGDHTAALRSPLQASAGKSPVRSAIDGREWTGLVCALLALTAWIICHPYSGMVHDNRIYALLALNYRDPAAFTGELFLKYGSQDSFTFFSPIYAWTIGIFGLDWSTRLLTAAGQVLWVLCALLLIRRMVTPRFTWLALLLLAAYPPYYDGYAIFSLAEGFLTPRIFAEAMGLAAIAAFLSGRAWLAVLALVIGGLLHPLMVIAPAVVIATTAMLRGRPLWWTVALVAGGSALVLLGVAAAHMAGLPFLPQIDPQWRHIVNGRTGQLLLANWTGAAWLPVSADVSIVVLASMTASPRVRQLLLTVLAVAVGSLAVSFIGFDLLNDVTIGKAQVWRSLWLLHALAPISLVLVIQDISSRDVPERRLILTLAFGYSIMTAICFALWMPPLGISLAFLLAVLSASVLTDGAFTRSRSRDVLVIWAGFALILAMCAGIIITQLRSGFGEIDGSLLQTLIVASAIVLAGVLLLTDVMRGARQFLAIVALAMLCLALFRWDARSEWRRYMDSAPDLASEIPFAIAPGEVVYWPIDVMAIWGGLQRPSFYSEVHGAGVIFNRGTALGFLHRLQLVSRFEPKSGVIANLLGNKPPAAVLAMEDELRLEDLVELCSNDDHPDVMVLAQDVAGANGKPWKLPMPYTRTYVASSDLGGMKPEDVTTRDIYEYYFYRCRDLRQDRRGDVRPGRAGPG